MINVKSSRNNLKNVQVMHENCFESCCGTSASEFDEQQQTNFTLKVIETPDKVQKTSDRGCPRVAKTAGT